jgi:hypothetical protein
MASLALFRSARMSARGMERVKGIEPSSSAWKAVALPLSYTRIRDQLSVISGQDAHRKTSDY